jgi:protein-tyrosine phosphatase
MIDIHHHLLWDLDDGPHTPEQSLDMARAAARDGITHIVATSHGNNFWEFQPELVAQRTAQLRADLAAEHISLTLGSGCDFHLSYDNIAAALREPARFAINNGGYLLVELPEYGFPRQLAETFYEFQLAGLTPILTHPERNHTLQSQPQRMQEWLRGGMLIQITAGSITGAFGHTAQNMAHRLLADNWVHFVATDAHNLTSRPPLLSAARSWVTNRHGSEAAERLFVTNPLAVFESRQLPPQPTPRGVFDDKEPNRTLLQRLLRR